TRPLCVVGRATCGHGAVTPPFLQRTRPSPRMQQLPIRPPLPRRERSSRIEPMNHWTWPALLLTAGFWLGAARPARAHTAPLPRAAPPHNPSHLPISDGRFDPEAAEELLAQRLRRARDGREFEGLKKLVEDLLKDKDFQEKLKDPEFLKELQRKAKTDPDALVNDPSLKPLLEKFREGKDGQKGPSPELLDDLKKQMEKFRPGASPNPKS